MKNILWAFSLISMLFSATAKADSYSCRKWRFSGREDAPSYLSLEVEGKNLFLNGKILRPAKYMNAPVFKHEGEPFLYTLYGLAANAPMVFVFDPTPEMRSPSGHLRAIAKYICD